MNLKLFKAIRICEYDPWYPHRVNQIHSIGNSMAKVITTKHWLPITGTSSTIWSVANIIYCILIASKMENINYTNRVNPPMSYCTNNGNVETCHFYSGSVLCACFKEVYLICFRLFPSSVKADVRAIYMCKRQRNKNWYPPHHLHLCHEFQAVRLLFWGIYHWKFSHLKG